MFNTIELIIPSGFRLAEGAVVNGYRIETIDFPSLAEQSTYLMVSKGEEIYNGRLRVATNIARLHLVVPI